MHECQNHKICSDDAIKKAEFICEDKSLRFTEIRKFIFKLIWKSHKPSKAYDLLSKISKMNYSAKPPTVYRALDFLLDNGFIHKINSLNAYIGCSHPLKHNECYFMICKNCDEIKECCDEAITESIKKTLSSNRFSSKNIGIEITGDCYQCAKG
jgi:Fur family zinc uptake transcriptional regulator|tara:strand:+ start:5285 stop:5746 length:462 start_codon:yes stop_codon:yes gene_type:complete